MSAVASAALVGAPGGAHAAHVSSQEEEICSSNKIECKHFTDSNGCAPSGVKGRRHPLLGRFGRWALLACLSAMSILLVVADLHAFGGRVGSSWIARLVKNSLTGSALELVLLSLTILVLSGFMTPSSSVKQNGRKLQRNAGEGASCSNSCGVSRTVSTGSPVGTCASPSRKNNLILSKRNHQIDLAARNGDLEKAEQLLLELERSDDQPDAVSYNLVIRACANRRDPDAAERWLKRMEAMGLQPSSCSYNTLLDACAKADKPGACERWLNRMIDRGITANVISYATAIYAHARHGDVVSAEAVLRKMTLAGLQPDAVSYNSLIHACSVKGAAHDAERWLREMHSQGLEGNVSSYTAVIDACAKSGDIVRAEAWFARLLEKGVEPNVVTFSAMIDACAKTGNLTRAEHWHDRMLERGISPNAHSYSAIIHACAKRGGPGGAEAAEQWLDRSERAGVVNDVVVYSSVIDACSKAGDAERGMEVFRRMREKGLKPHIVAYGALARPYGYRGDWIKVESIAQTMASDGVKTNDYFVYAQLLAYGVARPRQAQRAEACFRSALKSGVKANDHVVGVLSRAVGRPRCIELMNELCGGRDVPSPPGRRGQDSSNTKISSGRVGMPARLAGANF